MRDPVKSRERQKRYRERHPERRRAQHKKWVLENQEYVRRCRKERNCALYGITPEIKDQRIAQQDGRCAICGTKDPGGRWGTFATDHDHATGQLRGELCVRCNKGVGFFDENPLVLRIAAEYMEKHSSGA